MLQDHTRRPRSARGGEAAIMKAWERFLAGDGMAPDAVRRLVEDSWTRCLERGVSPDRKAAPLVVKDDGLYRLRDRHGDLIRAAQSVMTQAREFLAESGTVMALTDPSGVILWMEGDAGAKDHGEGIQLVPGGHWAESISGTNAIGTALTSGQPVQICAAEHFCEGIKHWTCSATVVRDPYDGSILGVLDISGLSGSHNAHCLALAVAGASRMENNLASLEMERRARLLDLTLGQKRRSSDNGLVVFDRRGRMVRANENAGLFLNGLGLDLGACETLNVAAAMGRDGEPNGAALPPWLRPDWLEPVIEHDQTLGTALVIPMPRHRRANAPTINAEAVARRASADPFDAIIGDSRALTRSKARARQLARLHVPVLLLGPTGAGKEVFARALHAGGSTPDGPFVPLNCGGMTRDLLASELFGYVEGAFTGARRGGMAGKFEAADGGTLFLDEIGEMPLELQSHFLRVLEDGIVYRLGDNRARHVKVRLIAATNRDLRAEVAAGNFRMDLFYRLSVTTLQLPGLEEHKEDIPTLVRHFAEQAARSYDVPLRLPTEPVMAALRTHSWPGNVRELRNVVETMVLLAQGDALTMDDLPADLLAPPPAALSQAEETSGDRLADNERAAIRAAVQAERGNLTRAAIRLGIAKSTLYQKMKRYGIDRASAGIS